MNVKKNNVGCLEGLCWSECGFDINSPGWCFTNKGFLNNNKTEIAAKCNFDSDCEPCWGCVTDCTDMKKY